MNFKIYKLKQRITKITQELQANVQNIREQLIQQQNAIKEAIANEAIANSIIIVNVTDKVLKFIGRSEKKHLKKWRNNTSIELRKITCIYIFSYYIINI